MSFGYGTFVPTMAGVLPDSSRVPLVVVVCCVVLWGVDAVINSKQNNKTIPEKTSSVSSGPPPFWLPYINITQKAVNQKIKNNEERKRNLYYFLHYI